MLTVNLQGYIEIVSPRDRDTLANIMNSKVLVNSIYRLDEWRGYENPL